MSAHGNFAAGCKKTKTPLWYEFTPHRERGDLYMIKGIYSKSSWQSSDFTREKNSIIFFQIYTQFLPEDLFKSEHQDKTQCFLHPLRFFIFQLQRLQILCHPVTGNEFSSWQYVPQSCVLTQGSSGLHTLPVIRTDSPMFNITGSLVKPQKQLYFKLYVLNSH